MFFFQLFIFVPRVQCDLIQLVYQSPVSPMQDEDLEEDSPLETSSDYHRSHSLGDSEESQPSDEKSEDERVHLHQENKYVIFHSKLMQLMTSVHFPTCAVRDTRPAFDSMHGSMASFKISCNSCDSLVHCTFCWSLCCG